jgi:hypothetical protein
MKPLPNLDDEDAMLRRGRMSALLAARKEAAETLRDAHTFMQSNDWADWTTHARVARDAADRLITLAAMWDEVK